MQQSQILLFSKRPKTGIFHKQGRRAANCFQDDVLNDI